MARDAGALEAKMISWRLRPGEFNSEALKRLQSGAMRDQSWSRHAQ